MSLFHRHQWTEYARTYAPPVTGWSANSMTPDALSRFAFGVTTFLFHCNQMRGTKICGDTKTVECLGKVECNPGGFYEARA